MVTTNEFVETSAIPKSLVYETLNGRPLYYKGYHDVVAGILKPEDIMGSSDLQSIIVMVLAGTLWNKVDRKQYQLATNQSRLHVGLGDNLSADVAIFEKSSLPRLKGKYFDVPPKIVLEVDIKIDLNEIGSDVAYISEKTQELINFGVERVFWVLSKIRKVIIIQPNQDWIVTDWGNDITIMDDCIINIKRLLDEEEITY
ncbi:Uma2 family endonuclease [Spirosoma soli]|uniref:Uma2 family endonuclease n=1 Tax=Spirosoma soli TaxID=1770529 RepID=A0ABW5MDE8_9BACT